MPELGPVLGKGDAMWRALVGGRGDLIVYLDSDTRRFSRHFVTGMLGPLLPSRTLRFVKGFYRRPFATATGTSGPWTAAGSRSSRPGRCCRRSTPSWPAFAQPLAGEVAARRELLPPHPVRHRLRGGDGDAPGRPRPARRDGGMAQVDLDVRRNRHQPLSELGPMAYAVLQVVMDRLRARGPPARRRAPPFRAADGRLVRVDLVERPPFATLRAAASRGGPPLRLHRPRRNAARPRRVAVPHRGGRRSPCSPRARSRRATGPGWRW